MSASTARIVLTNQTLRWSSPVLFNDPFDVPRELAFGVEPGDIVDALHERWALLIEQPPEDTSNLEPRLRWLVEAVKTAQEPTLKGNLIASLRDQSKNERPSSESLDVLRQQWRDWLPDHRILCLTESPGHAAMWYHYADQYRGVVLEFACIDELDSAWLMAKPVTYPKVKPGAYTATGWAELLCMPQENARRALLDSAIYTKSPDWSYEQEWRIATFKRPMNTGHFTDYKFHPNELVGVYFGPLIESEDRTSISALAATFPAVRQWNLSIGMSRDFTITPAGGALQ